MKRVFCHGVVALMISIASANDGVILAPGISLILSDQKVQPEMEQYKYAYFTLINDSDRAITAITAVWSYVSIETGQRKAAIEKTMDSYMMDKSRFQAVAAPHTRISIEPGAAGAHFFADARDRKITIVVDSIIFEDGEIVGPDHLRTADEITQRYAAAREVSSMFHGKDPEQVLSELKPSGPNRWRTHYLGKIAMSIRENPKATALHLRGLDLLPEPPKFWRTQK